MSCCPPEASTSQDKTRTRTDMFSVLSPELRGGRTMGALGIAWSTQSSVIGLLFSAVCEASGESSNGYIVFLVPFIFPYCTPTAAARHSFLLNATCANFWLLWSFHRCSPAVCFLIFLRFPPLLIAPHAFFSDSGRFFNSMGVGYNKRFETNYVPNLWVTTPKLYHNMGTWNCSFRGGV